MPPSSGPENLSTPQTTDQTDTNEYPGFLEAGKVLLDKYPGFMTELTDSNGEKVIVSRSTTKSDTSGPKCFICTRDGFGFIHDAYAVTTPDLKSMEPSVLSKYAELISKKPDDIAHESDEKGRKAYFIEKRTGLPFNGRSFTSFRVATETPEEIKDIVNTLKTEELQAKEAEKPSREKITEVKNLFEEL